MKILEELQSLSQMFRDKKPISEIEARVVRLCETQEAEDQARLDAFNAETRPILICLESAGEFVAVGDIAKNTGITISRCKWLCDRMVKSKYIRWGNIDRYIIDEKGADLLHETPP